MNPDIGNFIAQYGLILSSAVFLLGVYLRDYRQRFVKAVKKASKTSKNQERKWIRRHLARLIGFFGELTLEAASLVFGLSIVGVTLGVFSLIFPPLLTQVQTYHDKILELTIIPITASSVLTGFALTAESIAAKDASTRNVSRWVKLFGVLCVLLSLGAVVIDNIPWWKPLSWDVLLSLAILALVMQALGVAWRLL